MTKLEELYSIIEKLEKLRVPINKEQYKSLDEFEEELIKDEVLPALSQDIAPRLNPIRRDLVLVVEYHPGEQIKVALSRKVKISDFTGAKSLVPISNPVKYKEKPIESDNLKESTRHIENHTKGLKVTFSDGTVVWYSQAIDTYIATIKIIGYERVAALGLTHSGYNIVSHEQRPTEPGRIWQHESDGWYIYTNINNMKKVQNLEQISEHYKLGLVIEEIKPKK